MRSLVKNCETIHPPDQCARSSKKYFGPLSAALMIGSIIAQPLQISCHQKAHCQTLAPKKAVSFGDAKKNPALRQAYLDGKEGILKNECVANILYDPDGAMARQECYRYPAFCQDELLDPPARANAAVMPVTELFGKKQKMNIFVYPRPFEENEEFLSIVVSRHEATHACDVFYGIRTKSRIYASADLEGVYSDLLVAVLEVRASGNIIRSATPARLEDTNIRAQMPNFMDHWDDLELYSGIFKTGVRFSLVRDTLEDYGDVASTIKTLMAAEEKKAGSGATDKR